MLSALVLAAGCGVKNTRTAAPIQDLDIDPSFTWSRVDSEAIGVLAVTIWDERLDWTEHILGSQLRDTLLAGPLLGRTRNLADRIAYHNPLWNVVGTAELADSIGWKTYTRLVDSYALNGNLSEGELVVLELALRDRLRYLVTARIEDQRTNRWQEVSDGEGQTEYIASRAMILDYKIYDLRDRDLVWSGWVEEAESNESTAADYEYDDASGFVGNLIGALLAAFAQPRPQVPEFDALLDASFANLAQNLFPPVPFLCEGPPGNELRCSLCPDLPGKFRFGEREVTLRLDGEKIFLRWADGSETKLREKIEGWPGEVRCGYCGSAYTWESEWMTLAPDGLPE